jgi:hypothetical protein
LATLYITEFSTVKGLIGTQQTDAPPMPPIAEQTVAIGAGSTQSAAFNANTHGIRLMADAVCSIVIGPATGNGPSAAATNMRLAANVPEKFTVPPGYKLAVITNS